MLHALQARRNAVAAGILALGVLVGVAIYARAVQTADDGQRLEDTKQYLRQMEVYGGTANVLASELREWFDGLWHGRSLAFTVVFLSVVLAAGARLALTPLPPPAAPPDVAGGVATDGGREGRGRERRS